MWKLIQAHRQGAVDDCDDLLGKKPDVMRRLEEGNFDVVVYDMIWLCSLMLAMKLNATAVLSSPMAAPTMLSMYVGNPVNLAYTPDMMNGYTNKMNFFQVSLFVFYSSICSPFHFSFHILINSFIFFSSFIFVLIHSSNLSYIIYSITPINLLISLLFIQIHSCFH